MKQLFYALLFALLLGSCNKSPGEESTRTVCPESSLIPWLAEKKAEYSSCRCLTGFRQGIYQNTPVIEIYGFDPLCDGINMVYKIDGSVWFSSADKPQYDDYTENVRDQSVIWKCATGEEGNTKE